MRLIQWLQPYEAAAEAAKTPMIRQVTSPVAPSAPPAALRRHSSEAGRWAPPVPIQRTKRRAPLRPPAPMPERRSAWPLPDADPPANAPCAVYVCSTSRICLTSTLSEWLVDERRPSSRPLTSRRHRATAEGPRLRTGHTINDRCESQEMSCWLEGPCPSLLTGSTCLR